MLSRGNTGEFGIVGKVWLGHVCIHVKESDFRSRVLETSSGWSQEVHLFCKDEHILQGEVHFYQIWLRPTNYYGQVGRQVCSWRKSVVQAVQFVKAMEQV